MEEPQKQKLIVLVIDGNNTSQNAPNNWSQLFGDGFRIRTGPAENAIYDDNDVPRSVFEELTQKFEIVVDQAEWNELSVVSYHDNVQGKRACVSIAAKKSPIIESQSRSRTIFPHLVLIRNLAYAQTNRWDYRTVVLGLIHSGVPCINSAKAFWYNEFEKPIMFSGLKAIQDRLGKDKFPLINQYYYSSYNSMGFIPGDYPQVVKVGHMDAGMGKMKVDHEQGMKDLASVVGIHGDYATSEPFIAGQYDLRIQKIGNKIRAFKRTGFSWKTNVDSMEITEIPLTEDYVRWITEASNLNGEYMDIITVDAVVSEADENKRYILEVNGCSSGIPYLTEEQDKHSIFCLCAKRLYDLYIAAPSGTETKLSEPNLALTTDTVQMRNQLEQHRLDYAALRQAYDENVAQLKRQRLAQNSPTRYKMYLRVGLVCIVSGLLLGYFHFGHKYHRGL